MSDWFKKLFIDEAKAALSALRGSAGSTGSTGAAASKIPPPVTPLDIEDLQFDVNSLWSKMDEVQQSDMGLPVVEIIDPSALTEAEQARLDEVANQPYILCALRNAGAVVPMMFYTEDGVIAFIGVFGNTSVTLLNSGEGWSFVSEEVTGA